MITTNYESVVIANAALDDEQIDAIVKNISDLIKDNGGEITELELWGRKRLAYPINKSKSGYYAIYRFSANPAFIAKLERMYRLDENIIRFLTTVLDKKALEYYETLKLQQEEENTVTVANEITETPVEKPEVVEEVKEETETIVEEVAAPAETEAEATEEDNESETK